MTAEGPLRGVWRLAAPRHLHCHAEESLGRDSAAFENMMKPKMVLMVHMNILYLMELPSSDSDGELLTRTDHG